MLLPIRALFSQPLGAVRNRLLPHCHGILERCYRYRDQALNDGVSVNIGSYLELPLAPRRRSPGSMAAAPVEAALPAPVARPMLVPPISRLAHHHVPIPLRGGSARHEVEELFVVHLHHGHGEGILVSICTVASDSEQLLDGLELHAIRFYRRERIGLVGLVEIDISQHGVRLSAAALTKSQHRNVEPVQRTNERFLQLAEDLVLGRPRTEHPIVLEAHRARVLVQHQYVVRGYLHDGLVGALGPGRGRGRPRPAVNPHGAPNVLQLVEELETHGGLRRELHAQVVRLCCGRRHRPARLARPLLGLAM
mmetsp:Transcript_39127/g.94188  ORF Transcript_39127/g.94188 Transcript_39127/m.94188 type:complete len:308 (-) Transcript_39127:1482-2405(-)